MINKFSCGINVIAFALAVAACIICAQGSQASTHPPAPVRRCAYHNSSGEQTPGFTLHVIPDDDAGDEEGEGKEERGVLDGQPFIKCRKASNACYSLWHRDQSPNGTGGNIFSSQGCWQVPGKESCNSSSCIGFDKHSKPLNTSQFCCCTGDFCNINVTDMYKPAIETLIKAPEEKAYLRQRDFDPFLVVFVAMFLLCLAMGIVFAAYRFYVGRAKRDKPPPDHLVHLMEGGGGGGHDSYSVEHLKLAHVVGQGRYGSVWKGNVRDQDVAVKIFPSHYRNYFLNERDIYCLPFMENPALLTYFGCDERVNVDGNSEYLLVLTYAPHGCLQDYLRANTVDCATFCKMAQGVAKGLAHLHSDVKKGDKSKPCVSHRDLNTRNILVKNDLTCCLCDLGFAMKISGSKYYYNGEEQHAETKSINDVGTLRYMAPEVLEGAVNLRDCESSLKQIDVYALGLVLWELASRCTEFYQGGLQQTPVYSLPYQAEVGHHPTFEQMQVLVSRHKARPLFPETWKDWTAIRLLRETVEDCWDQDAEARLTALCVEERLQELPPLWDRKRATMYVSGVSPTVNSTGPPPALLSVTPRETNQLCETTEDTAESAVKDIQESTASEGTVETMLTLSPSEPHPEPTYKISNHIMGGSYRPQPAAPQQPYQGRNPCLERNLMSAPRPDEDATSLVDHSFKHSTPHAVSHFNAPPSDGQPPPPTSGRPATPIPYVQNVSAVPKQHNVPGNGTRGGTAPRWTWGGGIKKLFDRRRFFGRSNGGTNGSSNDDEAKSNLLATTPTESKTLVVDTQVCLPAKNGKANVVTTTVNGFPPLGGKEKSVRPSTLPLQRSSKPDGAVSGGAVLEMRSSRHSLDEQFFSKGNSTSRLLKDINCRVKTPGDVPPAVRRARGKRTAERLSLYDDRMMASGDGDHSEALACADRHAQQCTALGGSGLVVVQDKDSSSF